MTDAQYAAWLVDPSAIKLVLVEVVVNVAGVDITRYLSTGGYTTSAADTPANTAYLPVVSPGNQFTESISLDTAANLDAGDIEIYNAAGERDSWLSDIWVNRPLQGFIGDPRWARSDFRMIFNGVVADIDSKSRDTLNLLLRDKLQRLNTPVSDVVLGGTTANKNEVIPLLFGECHNITPLLTNPATLEYQVHNGPIESIIEVRDNGVPVSFTPYVATGKFNLLASPVGAITVSAQGDKPAGVYHNTISTLVQRLATGYGKASDQFLSGDLDATNLAAFDTAHPQPVGIYLKGRENTLASVQQLAASVGAQVSMSRTGLLRLIQITFPPMGTPTIITTSQMTERSLSVVSRMQVVSAVKLGYCKNWTVQSGLLTAIPADHKAMFAMEWFSATASDATTKDTYKLNTEPVQIDTLLLTYADASAEALRELNIGKVPHTTYQFEGTPDQMNLNLGDAVTLVHFRYGMSAGLTGVVVGLTPNWITGRVTVQAII